MSRTQFQRLAVVTIVVLLATIAAQRLQAYGTHHHYAEAIVVPMERVVHIETREDRSSCLVQSHLAEVMEARAEADRERARLHREIAREQRVVARDARRIRVEAQALAREVERDVARELAHIRIDVR